jgi:hypothetical protein
VAPPNAEAAAGPVWAKVRMSGVRMGLPVLRVTLPEAEPRVSEMEVLALLNPAPPSVGAKLKGLPETLPKGFSATYA